MVHTADKGLAMVIMDKEDYANKVNTLLQDTNTFKVLKKYPTSNLKNKLISLLKDIKQTGGLSTNKYKQLYPTSAVPAKIYGLPKIHKVGTPLRPIVSSRVSITCGVAKELAYIIKPLFNNSRAKGWNQGRSSPPLMSRFSSALYQSYLQYKLSSKGYNRT